jgi:hypothetical protein
MYESLNVNSSNPVCQVKWSQKLCLSNEYEYWKNLYNLPFKLTKDTYIHVRWFQVRLIHRILGTNNLLFKMKYILTVPYVAFVIFMMKL